jgi:hypothetical protein
MIQASSKRMPYGERWDKRIEEDFSTKMYSWAMYKAKFSDKVAEYYRNGETFVGKRLDTLTGRAPLGLGERERIQRENEERQQQSGMGVTGSDLVGGGLSGKTSTVPSISSWDQPAGQFQGDNRGMFQRMRQRVSRLISGQEDYGPDYSDGMFDMSHTRTSNLAGHDTAWTHRGLSYWFGQGSSKLNTKLG